MQLRLFHSELLSCLNFLQDSLLELSLDLLALLIGSRFTMQCHEGSKIKLGGLEKFDLANVGLVDLRTASRLW